MEKFNLSEKIIENANESWNDDTGKIGVEDVKEFIEIITEASDDNDFDIMVEDGEDGDITIKFSEFIKQRAGDKLWH